MESESRVLPEDWAPVDEVGPHSDPHRGPRRRDLLFGEGNRQAAVPVEQNDEAQRELQAYIAEKEADGSVVAVFDDADAEVETKQHQCPSLVLFEQKSFSTGRKSIDKDGKITAYMTCSQKQKKDVKCPACITVRQTLVDGPFKIFQPLRENAKKHSDNCTGYKDAVHGIEGIDVTNEMEDYLREEAPTTLYSAKKFAYHVRDEMRKKYGDGK